MQPENKPYHLGNTDAEHERLIRQATRIAPVTERFFREAGVASGQRVLDIGAGVGDVAMLAAKIVGPSGEVIGIERDARTIARARVRAREAGFRNIEFIQSDIADYSPHASFDGVVGRYILQFLPDPAATLRSITPYVRPGGVVAFQEGSWIPFLALSAHLPLWSASVRLLQEAGARAGVGLRSGLYPLGLRLRAERPAADRQARLTVRRARGPRHAPRTAASRSCELEHGGAVDRARGSLVPQARGLGSRVYCAVATNPCCTPLEST
jgi:SAM-dependent methyltransferase